MRDYAPSIAIETDEKGFMKLAGYIGVINAPQNETKQAIAMTAPVVSFPNEEQTQRMQFILPSAVSPLSFPLLKPLSLR